MSRRVVKHALALLDLERCSETIRQHNPRAALRFLDAAEKTFRTLAAMPGIGAPFETQVPALSGLCSVVVSSKFKNYIVFYTCDESSVRIVRGLHGARDLPHTLAADSEDEDE